MSGLLAAAAALTFGSRAAANVAAPISDPGRIGPELAAQTPLVVREERLSFQCEEALGAPVCSFEARYQIENPTSEASGGRAAFYGLHAEDLVVKVDGQRSMTELSADDVKALDGEVAAAEGSSPGPSRYRAEDASLTRTGFTLDVPAGGKKEIVVTGRIKPGVTRFSRGYVYTPAEGRHLLTHAGDIESRIFELEYLVSPIKSWAAVGRIDVTVSYPRSWTVYHSFYGSTERAAAEWSERVEGDRIIASTTASGALDMKTIGNALELRISLPGAVAEHGGPFVGAGGVVGTSDARGFRARFGYEIAAPSWLIESLTVDTDFQRRVVVSPNIEAATPHITMIPILPSFSAGVGVPIQIIPKATVGARLQAGVQIWPVGFVTAIDIFPGLSSAEGKLQGSLMGRFSL